MKVSEIITFYKDQCCDYEVWQYTDDSRRVHTDHIKNIDSIVSYDLIKDLESFDYFLIDQEEYDTTILANSCLRADFGEWYDDSDAKILVVMLDFGTDIG